MTEYEIGIIKGLERAKKIAIDHINNPAEFISAFKDHTPQKIIDKIQIEIERMKNVT